jgi:hypothetical protein
MSSFHFNYVFEDSVSNYIHIEDQDFSLCTLVGCDTAIEGFLASHLTIAAGGGHESSHIPEKRKT